METEKFKIGYVDEEATWTSTFQRNLSDNFQVIIFDLNNDTTITNLTESIIREKLDCLVVDYELKESSLVTFNGDAIIAKIREKNPDFPVLIITGHDEENIVPFVEDTDIVRSKYELAERTELFIQRLTGKIISHKNRLEDINKKISALSTKKALGEITISEEDELNDLYYRLDRIHPEEKLLPNVLYERSNINQLNLLVEQTKNILNVLKENKK